MVGVRAAPGHVSGTGTEELVICLLLGMSPKIQGNRATTSAYVKVRETYFTDQDPSEPSLKSRLEQETGF